MNKAREYYTFFYRILRLFGPEDVMLNDAFWRLTQSRDRLVAAAAAAAIQTMKDWFTLDSLEGGLEERQFWRSCGDDIVIAPATARRWFGSKDHA